MSRQTAPTTVRTYVSPSLGTPTDGAPLTGGGVLGLANHRLLGTNRPASRRFTLEGPRGISTRAAVWFRYTSYLLIIVLLSVITGACFASVPGAHSGGTWMMLSAAFQLATAVVGSFFVPNHRPEIIQQLRAYVFGYTVLPGTGVAILMWAATRMTTPASGPDVFVSALTTALPWIFFLPIILPAVVFLKSVAGMRVINREQMDDQEMMRINTRIDGHQR